jgi:chromate transport protein ChrA
MVNKKSDLLTKPGIVDGVLILVLVIWIITVFVILNKTLTADNITAGLLSITAFSTLFSSIMMIIIAVLLEGIRKEIRS